MLVIGLTGGIASGKSTVSNFLKELGAFVLDADMVAREIVEPGRPALAEIKKHFGPGMLQEDGSLDRPAMARLVFSNPAARVELNAITHPRIIASVQENIRKIKELNPQGVIIIDAALLLESGMEFLFDEIWVVAADEDTQVQRIMERDKLSREEALRRIQAQMPLVEKLRRAHRVIDAGKSLQHTRDQVEQIWRLVAGPGCAGFPVQ